MTLELPESDGCVFCAIVAGNTEARWEVRPGSGEANGLGVACFHNQLKWARVMLLIVPTRHMTQQEFWSSHVLVDAASLAVKMGEKHCRSDGYRVISNFGRVAHQSQVHAHLHVVSGTSHQIGAARKKSGKSLAPGMTDAGSDGPGAKGGGVIEIEEYEVDEVPFAAKISPPGSPAVAQRDFWDSGQILGASRAALRIGEQYSPEGYRLISSFDPAGAAENAAGNNAAGLFLFGGGQLGLYV